MIALGFTAALFFSSFVSAAVSSRDPHAGLCGSVISAESIIQAELHFNAFKISVEVDVDVSIASTRNITVPVVFHVISEDDTLEGGNVPDEQVAAQMDVLNDSYGQSGVSFILVDTVRTKNATWFNSAAPDTAEAEELKTTLHVGGPETLNVYSVGFTEGLGVGLLGYSSWPWDYAGAPGLDGILFLYSTLPGGTTVPYNLGKTLSHEVGHWLGLYHTFQGNSCSGDGDFVDDTAPESFPAYTCEADRDTCPGDSLPDPIHNYMDYTDDSCLNQFTPGQATRLFKQYSVFRSP